MKKIGKLKMQASVLSKTLLLILLVMAMVTLVGSQPAGAREPFVITPEFRAARELILGGYFDEGVQSYLVIAAQHPGTMPMN